MKTDEEKIAVMQAYVDGKGIRMSLLSDPDYWTGSFDPAWNWEKIDYKVEPEPMVIYKIKYTGLGYYNSRDYSTLKGARLDANMMVTGEFEIVKFVEDMSCTTK